MIEGPCPSGQDGWVRARGCPHGHTASIDRRRGHLPAAGGLGGLRLRDADLSRGPCGASAMVGPWENASSFEVGGCGVSDSQKETPLRGVLGGVFRDDVTVWCVTHHNFDKSRKNWLYAFYSYPKKFMVISKISIRSFF